MASFFIEASLRQFFIFFGASLRVTFSRTPFCQLEEQAHGCIAIVIVSWALGTALQLGAEEDDSAIQP